LNVDSLSEPQTFPLPPLVLLGGLDSAVAILRVALLLTF